MDVWRFVNIFLILAIADSIYKSLTIGYTPFVVGMAIGEALVFSVIITGVIALVEKVIVKK